MPTRELLAPSQRAQFTDFTAPLDDRTLACFYTLSDTELEPIPSNFGARRLTRQDYRFTSKLGNLPG